MEKNRTVRWKSICSLVSQPTTWPVYVKCVLQVILLRIIGAWHYIIEKPFFHLRASQWDGTCIYKILWVLDVLYKKFMYSSTLFLGWGEKSKIDFIEHNASTFKSILSKWFLQFDKIVRNIWSRKKSGTPTIDSGEVNWQKPVRKDFRYRQHWLSRSSVTS